MRDFRKIRAWQLADEATVAVYQATKSFPKEEVYGLTSQIRRAASSVPANIAEGASRSSLKDYLHFLYIARGSCSEPQYFIHLAGRLGYLDAEQQAALDVASCDAGQTLYGLIKAVESEAGVIKSAIAKVTSLFALGISSLAFRL